MIKLFIQKSGIFLFTLLIPFLLFSQSPKREMRAAWIATVSNIDWPSKQGLSTQEQQEELTTMLDKLAQNNINTVIFQIRPTADALYNSYFEPWSHWLSGQQGIRPDPYYDPLEFIIEESHKRFMQLHVWINPYRVTTNKSTSTLHPEHLFYKDTDLFVNYCGKYYFNPGLDKTREYLNSVVKDIVGRYDVDAIHFDDYFYPYKEHGMDFPDQSTFEEYPRGYQPWQKDEWRRNNVNMIIAELQQTIKSVKPWVEFGISPFGVWRNNNVDSRGSATRAGIQNYDDLYADILKWLKEGTIDYVAPQLYWEIGKSNADYSILADWWSKNSYNKNLYIGLAVYKLGNKPDAKEKSSKSWSKGNELIRQLNENKKHHQIDGVMYFSAKNFLDNRLGLNDSLQNNYYKYPALHPINRNVRGLLATQPNNLQILKDGDQAFLFWDKVEKHQGEKIIYYIVYAFKGKKVGNLNDPANILARTRDNFLDLKNIPDKKLSGNYTFVVTAVNRYHYESVPTFAVQRKL